MKRGRASRWLTRICLVLGALLAISEIGARVYLRVSGRPAGGYIQVNQAMREARDASRAGFDMEYPYLPFRPAPGMDRDMHVNRMGFIGPGTRWEPPEGALRLLFIGGSMVYYDEFPEVLDNCLDSLLASGEPGYDSCELLISSGPTWTSMENMVYYVIRGVYAEPHVIVVYVAVNDVYAMFVPDSVDAAPDYSHYRDRMMPVPSVPWDFLPGWADSSRAIALSRYALDRLMYPTYQESPPPRLGIRYRYHADQAIDTTFSTYEASLEAMAAIAVSRNSRIYFVSELHDSTLSHGGCRE